MQLEAPEKPDNVFVVTEESFPFRMKGGAGMEYYCSSYSDLSEILTTPANGQTLIQHAMSLYVGRAKNWKRLSLESISQNPVIALYMVDYARATCNYVKSHLFPGDLSEQPNILYGNGQAFDVIRNAISECELENHRVLKQQANANNVRQ